MNTALPVEFSKSEITGGFWKERQDLFRNVTINAIYDRFEETGRFEALKFNWKEGMPFKPHIFWESDVTKWIEGAAYFLQKQDDPELEARIDELVRRMERTQGEDGYLNAYFTVVEPEARFTRRMDHELYCAGHLIEGAIAYANATGKTAMLQVARKYADLIDRVFRVEQSAVFASPGHEEIELALVKLYHFTNEKKYLELAEYFINVRGTSEKDADCAVYDQVYVQSHMPVRKQRSAVGHSVRALYLYCAMADLAMETDDEELKCACEALFDNMTNRRMYITGGFGSTHRGEAFTFDYDLPDYAAYSETCASIAMMLFCRRMWLIDQDGKYADCMERALYNTVLSGISLSGDHFFYENPLAADPEDHKFNDSLPEETKKHLPIMERVKVFSCSCCPPNLLRIVGAIADYLYSTKENAIFVHTYMESCSCFELNGTEIRLEQKTEYPYRDSVEITVRSAGAFSIALHIPGWCRAPRILINGEAQELVIRKGYAYLSRSWAAGDVIELCLPMEVKFIEANPRVISAAGRVAVTCGPLVYCAEGIDNDEIPLRSVRVLRDPETTCETVVIGDMTVPAIRVSAEKKIGFEELYRESRDAYEKIGLHLIPYFARANRGITEMTTWFLR